MANRRAVLDTCTTVLKGTFANVSNRYHTVEDLLDRPQRYEQFPWLNVGLGPQNIEFALAGDIEIDSSVPVYIIAYCESEGEDLQLEVADLIDNMVLALRGGYATFTEATFGLVSASFYPYEDEDRSNIGWVFGILRFETGNN